MSPNTLLSAYTLMRSVCKEGFDGFNKQYEFLSFTSLFLPPEHDNQSCQQGLKEVYQ